MCAAGGLLLRRAREESRELRVGAKGREVVILLELPAHRPAAVDRLAEVTERRTAVDIFVPGGIYGRKA
jgi:hypothetical protein